MPKLKTNKSVRSRFKVTGTGKVMRRKCGKSHQLYCKSAKQKRILRRDMEYLGIRRKYIKRLLLVEGK